MLPAGSRTMRLDLLGSLDGAAVHVWRAGIDAGPVDTVLLYDEKLRAERMSDERRRARFLASRAWLRVILGRYLGVDAAAVRFSVASRGKPSIVDGGTLSFSLSRSADVALIAVTRGRAVGVDVEHLRTDVDHDGLAGRFFAPAEAEALRRLPPPERVDAFFRLWARKEAIVKASGAGLGDGVGHLDVRSDRVEDRWSVASLDAGPGFAAAVAVAGEMGAVTTGAADALP